MDFCDLTCRYASRPENDSLDGSGSCRSFQALYCSKRKRHVHKNMPCPDKVGRYQDPEARRFHASGE